MNVARNWIQYFCLGGLWGVKAIVSIQHNLINELMVRCERSSRRKQYELGLRSYLNRWMFVTYMHAQTVEHIFSCHAINSVEKKAYAQADKVSTTQLVQNLHSIKYCT
jgi:hypothetical protein